MITRKQVATKSTWKAALRACADPQRAKRYLDLLSETEAGNRLGNFSERARILAAVLSGSEALSGLLVSHTEWLDVLEPDRSGTATKEGLRQEVEGWFEPLLETGDFGVALGRLREFKRREMLRIGGRDLARLGKVWEITRELSDLADLAWRTSGKRAGCNWNSASAGHTTRMPMGRWHATEACVLGMGKLGGQELNYSSDVDVLFVYAEEGQVYKDPPLPTTNQTAGARSGNKTGAGRAKETRHAGQPAAVVPRPVMTSHQFFNRLGESFIAEVGRLGPEGSLYRIDLRLRPEGDSGPLSRSVGGYENYYVQWGQTWERMMLIKARGRGGERTAGGPVPRNDPAVSLSAFCQRECVGRNRGDEGSDRDRGGQNR